MLTSDIFFLSWSDSFNFNVEANCDDVFEWILLLFPSSKELPPLSSISNLFSLDPFNVFLDPSARSFNSLIDKLV